MKNLHFLRLHFERLCGISERTLLEFLKCSQLIDKLCIARLINSPHITPFFCFFSEEKWTTPFSPRNASRRCQMKNSYIQLFVLLPRTNHRIGWTERSHPFRKKYTVSVRNRNTINASRSEQAARRQNATTGRSYVHVFFAPVLWSFPNCSLRGHRKHQPRLLSSFFPGGTACFIIFGWRFKDVFLTTFYDVCHRSVD